MKVIKINSCFQCEGETPHRNRVMINCPVASMEKPSYESQTIHPDCPLDDHKEYIIERFGIVEEEMTLMQFVEKLPKKNEDSLFMHKGSDMFDVMGTEKKPKLLAKFYIKEVE